MERYYDQKCALCDTCLFYQSGTRLDGSRYMACRQYGYIIHEDLPVSDARCSRYCDGERQTAPDARRQARSIRELARLRAKH